MGSCNICTGGREKALALVVLVIASTVICSATCDHQSSTRQFDDIHCHEKERTALIKFKQQLDDDSADDLLGSWDIESRPDCCKWTGVTCHNQTGYVLELNLGHSFRPLSGALSPSLLELKHIRRLDLSGNNFGGAEIPSFLGSMKELRYLNLSFSGFYGEIPSQLGGLSKLRYLDVSDTYFSYSLRSQSVEWLEGMPNLKYLGLSNVDLSGETTHFWEHASNNLSFLLELHLSGCNLPSPLPILNFTSLRVLDISCNFLSSEIPRWIANMSSLESLNLSVNNFYGTLPPGLSKLPCLHSLDVGYNYDIIGNFSDMFEQGWTSIRKMDFSCNRLNGEIPSSIGNLSSLVELGLAVNDVNGVIPDSIGNLTSLVRLLLSSNHLHGAIPESIGNLGSLVEIYISQNNLTGKIPDSICNLHNLQKLYLNTNLLQQLPHLPPSNKSSCMHSLQSMTISFNNLHGTIPTWVANLSSISWLSLEHNQLSGAVPTISNLSKLTTLELDNNILSGALTESHFEQVSKLTKLDVSSNQLVININRDWVPPFQLVRLLLGSCRVGPDFPLWLRTQTRLDTLDLSNTSLQGVLPMWFWKWTSSPSFNDLNLSENQIEGQLPSPLPTIAEQISLSSNKFSGSMPQFRNTSIRLFSFDISANNFSGPLPQSLGRAVLLLLAHGNQIDGTIPTSIFQQGEFIVFDLSQNQITGNIPANLGNCSSLERLDLSNNHLIGEIPESVCNLRNLKSLHLKKNLISGKLPVTLGNCSGLEILDISENNMSGSIRFLLHMSNNSRLRIVSLRDNFFVGEIPSGITRMLQLQIFDASKNGLSGRIPPFQGMRIQGTNLSFAGSNFYYTEKLIIVVKGRQYEYSSILHLVTCIDLSSNYFHGEIPQQLMGLSGLMFLNLSHNRLTGKIPWNVGRLVNLECLDLSNNQLTGEIPPSLSNLMFLDKLNFSNNRLQGRIPTGPQLGTFSSLSYVNNLDLCGPPLEKQCPKPATVVTASESSGFGRIDVRFYCLGMISGWVVGVWGIFGILMIRKDLRFAFFNSFDVLWANLVMVVLRSLAFLKNK